MYLVTVIDNTETIIYNIDNEWKQCICDNNLKYTWYDPKSKQLLFINSKFKFISFNNETFNEQLYFHEDDNLKCYYDSNVEKIKGISSVYEKELFELDFDEMENFLSLLSPNKIDKNKKLKISTLQILLSKEVFNKINILYESGNFSKQAYIMNLISHTWLTTQRRNFHIDNAEIIT